MTVATRRIPIQHKKGIFHPKNAFLLVEEREPDDQGQRPRALLVASMSANLTRAGWWENVETCHVEELADGARTRMRDDLVAFLDSVRNKARAETDHSALKLVREFLHRRTESRTQRVTDDSLHSHFYSGREPLIDFLNGAAGQRLRGCYLEVLSPYFDDAKTCEPLHKLIMQFEPKEVRVFLPRSENGEAQCRAELYEDVRSLQQGGWGTFPKEVKKSLRLGQANDAGERFMHAKLYRFFTQNPKREIYFVGSANLTKAAHNGGGNVETGFLVEVVPERRPDFWLVRDDKKPVAFRTKGEGDDAAASGGTRLNLCFHWDTGVARAFWDAPSESPTLRIDDRGITIGSVGPLASRTWVELKAEFAAALRVMLGEHGLLHVYGEGELPGLLLVQEESLSHKPSLLLQLSATDILRYWALLTSAQRSAFLEARAPEAALLGAGADLVARAKTLVSTDTYFDRFAGFFHAFGCLEQAVRAALQEGPDHNPRDATYRLFGKKHDSLGSLLIRVLAGDGAGDSVDQYVILLCAQQLCREIARDFPEFWKERRNDARALEDTFESAKSIRDLLITNEPASLPGFLDWFDRRFLVRASRGSEEA